MKTYNVKEIAEMLKTNPETVRRWIRLGKLKADKQSRKGGNEITENNLNAFFQLFPKYAYIAAGTANLGIVGLIAYWVTLLGGGILTQKIIKEMSAEHQISISNIKKFIEKAITESSKTIEQKKEKIKQIQNEIIDEEREVDKLQKILSQIQLCD